MTAAFVECTNKDGMKKGLDWLRETFKGTDKVKDVMSAPLVKEHLSEACKGQREAFKRRM